MRRLETHSAGGGCSSLHGECAHVDGVWCAIGRRLLRLRAVPVLVVRLRREKEEGSRRRWRVLVGGRTPFVLEIREACARCALDTVAQVRGSSYNVSQLKGICPSHTLITTPHTIQLPWIRPGDVRLPSLFSEASKIVVRFVSSRLSMSQPNYPHGQRMYTRQYYVFERKFRTPTIAKSRSEST